MFDSKLNFKEHFNHIIGQAFKSLGFIIRTSRYFRSIETVVLLYVSLVRSKLEYASVVWSPHYNQHIEAIEKIQHKFTRFVYRKFHIPYQHYQDRLKTLNLQSLYSRRAEIDLLYLYKIVNGHISTSCISNIVMRLNRRCICNMNLFAIKR